MLDNANDDDKPAGCDPDIGNEFNTCRSTYCNEAEAARGVIQSASMTQPVPPTMSATLLRCSAMTLHSRFQSFFSFAVGIYL